MQRRSFHHLSRNVDETMESNHRKILEGLCGFVCSTPRAQSPDPRVTQMHPWTQKITDALRLELNKLANATKAAQMEAYMKHVAPFFGISMPSTRHAVKAALQTAGDDPPSSDDLQETVNVLLGFPEREFHYSSIEIVGKHFHVLESSKLVPLAEKMITTKSHWDTVDAIGTALVTPMVRRHPEFVEDMRRWLASGDKWLVRAAIQHQRGLKKDTDVGRVIEFCGAQAGEKEFFIAKAVGWALRDLAKLEPKAVRKFLKEHPGLPAVARREAERGLAASRK